MAKTILDIKIKPAIIDLNLNLKEAIMIGEKFGRLTVIRKANKPAKDRHTRWVCKCECGNIAIVQSNNLKSGRNKSCGCLQKEMVRKRTITHGLSKTREYASWCEMKSRCRNVKREKYEIYGARGIDISPEWEFNFEQFFKDIGERPKGYTLHRIDNDKGYSADNCKWASGKEQASNRRKRRWYKKPNNKEV